MGSGGATVLSQHPRESGSRGRVVGEVEESGGGEERIHLCSLQPELFFPV